MNKKDRANLVAHPTSYEIATTIEHLRQLLQREYGSDYSFTVIGEGITLAASNQRVGHLFAQVKP